jgi:hypothetical protein
MSERSQNDPVEQRQQNLNQQKQNHQNNNINTNNTINNNYTPNLTTTSNMNPFVGFETGHISPQQYQQQQFNFDQQNNFINNNMNHPNFLESMVIQPNSNQQIYTQQQLQQFNHNHQQQFNQNQQQQNASLLRPSQLETILSSESLQYLPPSHSHQTRPQHLCYFD